MAFYHFCYDGGTLVGRTAIGRTTVEVLRINVRNFVALREVLMEDGLFLGRPPLDVRPGEFANLSRPGTA
jgi:hypothetical protein